MVKAQPAKTGGKPALEEAANTARGGADKGSPCNIFTIIFGSVLADCQVLTGSMAGIKVAEIGFLTKSCLLGSLTDK